jgi:hypothetical protein
VVTRRLERALHHGPEFRRQPSSEHQHPVVIDPRGQHPIEMAALGLSCLLDTVAPSPGPDDPFDMRSGARIGEVE